MAGGYADYLSECCGVGCDWEFMMSNSSNESTEMDFLFLLSIIWKGKLIIFGAALLFLSIGVFHALHLPDIYKSEVLLAPTQFDNSSVGSLASKFGGIASLAGVSLNSGGSDKTAIGIEILKSRKFFKYFNEKTDISIELIAAQGWNKELNELVLDSDIYDEEHGEWLRKPSSYKKTIPSYQELHEEFLKRLTVGQNTDNGFVTVSFQHFSPNFASQIVESLVIELNRKIKERDVGKAEKSISYLKEQLQEKPIAELQLGLYELIQAQTETIMLAQASPEYLFQIIDPAIVEEKRVKPNRPIICAMYGFIGIIFGTLIAIINGLFRSHS
jgi:uncharacterized protein involved in exopolysaccharide biosynthesis